MLLSQCPTVGSASRAASPPFSSSSTKPPRDAAILLTPQDRKVSLRAAISKQLGRLGDSSSSLAAATLLPVAAACTVLVACPPPAEAGFLSGLPGLESFELPTLPTPDSVKKIREENVAKAKALDSNFKNSPFLQQLLKKSKENKEMHRKAIEDKYCERGAEWGVGDCSLVGLPKADRDAFFEALKKGKAESRE